MLELGILKTFDSENHKAGVQLAGSLTTYLDDIAVATNIAPEAMTIGNYVLVAIPGGNPRDACVVASWPQGSSGIRDHGDLDGLADDDHSQYLNVARHDLPARHPLANLDPLVCSEAEADSKITTHKNDASAHHTKTTSSEIDHGSVQGLGDDDHSQYLNIARHDLTARHPLGSVVPHESALNNLGNVNAPSPSDDQALAWDAATSKWIPQTLGGGGGAKIQDADGDTSWDVEESADEDKIHGKVKGVEAFLLDAAGILTLAKQSAARAYFTGSKYYIKDRVRVKVRLNTEDYDIQSEFDSTEKTGAATATTANHLIDTTKNQFTADDVGRTVWNSTDNTYAVVTAYNSVSDLTLDTNIMTSGESYYLYAGRFTAKVSGLYLIAGMIRYYPGQDQMHAQNSISKNGVRTTLSFYQSGSGGVTVPNTAVLFLAVGDYIELWTWNDSTTSQQQFDNASGSCWMAVAKIA